MATPPRSLYGTVVAITGGARGIGRATATALARQGARVAIGDLDGPLAEREAAALGGGAVGLPLDVTDRWLLRALPRRCGARARAALRAARPRRRGRRVAWGG